MQEHDLYRTVIPGTLDVSLPADWDGAIEALEAAFPGSRDRVAKFFDLVKQITFWQVAAMRGMPADRIDSLLFSYGLRPARDVLDEFFDDGRIKAALAPYWTYLGQPPSKLPFQDLALTLFAYLEYKPWHVRSGSQAMSTAILDAFLQAGGEVRFNTAVATILTDHGKVRGVRLADGTEITAPDVVSNTSLPVTYGMLDGLEIPAAVRADMATRRLGVSGFVLHMGLDATPAELGFTTSTTFVNVDTDDERTYRSWRTFEPARGICVSCYDVAPIGFAPSGASHISLMTLQYADIWHKVAPADYARTKFAYAQTLLDLVEHVTPGTRGVIEEIDVATPLTMMRYLGHPGGAIYGLRPGCHRRVAVPQQRRRNWRSRPTSRWILGGPRRLSAHPRSWGARRAPPAA
ncbi:phytoene desaturase family protein [Nocardia nepalensis]|uniref:phytoene desaturase family protein n=1 Tax=Nocardia nepalensis TaxID=3375448 RepID=UPI003B673E00